MRSQMIVLGVVLSSWALLGSPRGTPAHSMPADMLYTATSRYEPLAWMTGKDRFSGASIERLSGTKSVSLFPNFAASADPEVSFKGDHILFAGKRTENDRWQVWEAALPSGTVRQLTFCKDDCIRPLYLPDERFVYAQKTDGHFAIATASLAGGNSSLLTFSPANSLPTTVLRDGRILFQSSYAFGDASHAELYTVYSDGSGVESYRCDHGGTRHSGRELSSGDIVFASRSGLARFTSALAHEVPLNAPPGEYAGDVAETESGQWLLAHRRSSNDRFRIELWKPGALNSDLLVARHAQDIVQPVLVQARVIPNRHPSALHDWDYANLLCLNSYTSKYNFADKSIASVHVYTRDPAGSVRLLGTSPVEEDGSFYLRTPADQPIKIALLDAAGRTLKQEAGWFWLRRGEQRVCVGCHAGPETAPENRTPAVLKRSTLPADLTRIVNEQATGGK